ncbi:RNA-directed DNA polymerase from mobile element jockey [Vespula squamosa]|uniref:RNA-directed DNA polymerase from mobile element jockey n=1 Tax=Vespula squamosa TaxID=30214 RepID=A0ABD2AK49_VESSQ
MERRQKELANRSTVQSSQYGRVSIRVDSSPFDKDLHLPNLDLYKEREPTTAGLQSRLKFSKPALRNQFCKRETRETFKPYLKTVKRTSYQSQQMDKGSTMDRSVPLNNEEYFKSFKKYCTLTGIQYHKYSVEQDKIIAVILKGLPKLDKKEIIQKLERNNLKPLICQEIQKDTNSKYPIYK